MKYITIFLAMIYCLCLKSQGDRGIIDGAGAFQNLTYNPATGIIDISSGIGDTIPIFGGATVGADGEKGLVPKPLAGQEALFLRGDGTFANPTVGGDNWGSQVVQVTARFTGDGTSGSSLELAQQGATSGQALKWNGTSWAPGSDLDVQTLSTNLGTKEITISGGNTISIDDWFLDAVTTSVELEGDGSSVTPLGIAQQAASSGQALKWNGSSWAPAADNDAQTLSFVSPNLSITSGNSVDLSAINTDAQTLSLVTNSLTISGGNSVSLALYLDNTDAQTLSLAGTLLSISGGNSQDLASIDTDDQTLGFTSPNLSIAGGNSVNISSINTDAQTLSFVSPNLTISGGNSVDLSDLAGSNSIYSANGSINEARTVDINNVGTSSLSFIVDSANVTGPYWTVWMYDPGFTNYHSRIMTSRTGTYIRSLTNRIDVLTSGINIERTSGTGTLKITDNGSPSTGIQYAADYSANYTSRSLVDKGYVDASAGSFSTAANVTSNAPGSPSTDDFVFGSTSLDNVPGTPGYDSRIFFDKSKSYFFAGYQDSSNVDEANRGSYAICIGGNGYAGGFGSLSLGYQNNAGASYSSTIGGNNNSASGTGAVAMGGLLNEAIGFYSHAQGYGAKSSLRGEVAYGPGYFTAAGDCQRSDIVAYRSITGTGAQNLYVNGTSDRVYILLNKAWYFEVEVVAVVQTAGTGATVVVGDMGTYKYRGRAVNNGGTVTGTSDLVYESESTNFAGGTVTITINNTNDSVDVSFDPGNANWATDTVTRCVAKVSVVQVGI